MLLQRRTEQYSSVGWLGSGRVGVAVAAADGQVAMSSILHGADGGGGGGGVRRRAHTHSQYPRLVDRPSESASTPPKPNPPRRPAAPGARAGPNRAVQRWPRATSVRPSNADVHRRRGAPHAAAAAAKSAPTIQLTAVCGPNVGRGRRRKTISEHRRLVSAASRTGYPSSAAFFSSHEVQFRQKLPLQSVRSS